MSVVVRFAPSPTGYLHIGSARTALFNWLFARHYQGKMLLRIEDTDRARSTQEAVEAIYKGLEWLEIGWDETPVHQFDRLERHVEIANELLKKGMAYYCYCSPEELETMREEARAKGLPPRYNGKWRDRSPEEAPKGIDPVVRFKSPQTGDTVIHDLVQGEVRVSHQQLDDMILLRADGTPTFNLSVVVDDHDMGITHIIRGDDHLTNMFRQFNIFKAMEWAIPHYAHIPLIHGPDGAKLSKRHGALGVEAYRDMGFLPEAIRNYLLRLGWSHGDEEIISTKDAIQWFDLDHVGKSPARFDFVKLTNLNGHYLREADNERLVTLVIPFIESKYGISVNTEARDLLRRGMTGLKQRAKTLIELAENSLFYIVPQPLDEAAQKILNEEGLQILKVMGSRLPCFPETSWTEVGLEDYIRQIAEERELKLTKATQPLRAALTGKTVSPSVFDIMHVLGKDKTLERLYAVLKGK
ncbi:MAG: glutamate--tRNA ligase [Alphaproteobacteria bacterium 41-28]|nr:MAG: glutamate--tRNA ligase [Alphaproteobacteria bacterium 41-28]